MMRVGFEPTTHPLSSVGPAAAGSHL
jgi:hypothetical protein